MLRLFFKPNLVTSRLAGTCHNASRKGLVLGAYEGCEPGEIVLTAAAERFDETIEGKLKSLLKGTSLKKGKAFTFGNLSTDFTDVAISGLGPEAAGLNKTEVLDECKENIRIAAGVATRALQEKGVPVISVEDFDNAEAAGEGATLGMFRYQDLKCDDGDLVPTPNLELYDSADEIGWKTGRTKAEAQNAARKLESTPANLMTPSIFAQFAVELLCPCGIKVEAHTRDWLEEKHFHGVLTMAKGSCEAPIVLELVYCGLGRNVRPIVFAAKGTSYDTGGLQLKKGHCHHKMEWRADLAAASTIVGVFKAAATLSLPINITALIPLHENMISGMAVKPGDVVITMNGKSIRIDNTDNEGRVSLADALLYSHIYSPCLVMSVADLSSGLRNGIGDLPSGVFSTSDDVWNELNRAGSETGDRFWRFPLWKTFYSAVTNYQGVDVTNSGTEVGGNPCLGAAFLYTFAPPVDFAHIDISGTGLKVRTNLIPYLQKGTMSGRPTRAIVQFLYQLACPHTKIDCSPH